MDKFFGMIGFSICKESAPGVWSYSILERPYFGEILNRSMRYQSTNELNDNIAISNRLSIVSDPYAYENYKLIKYVVYKGVKWKVSSIDFEHPCLILSLSEVYNDGQ